MTSGNNNDFTARLQRIVAKDSDERFARALSVAPVRVAFEAYVLYTIKNDKNQNQNDADQEPQVCPRGAPGGMRAGGHANHGRRDS